MRVHEVCVTRIVSVYIKSTMEIPVFDEDHPEQGAAHVQRAVTEVDARIAAKLDRFVQELGDPMRFRGNTNPPCMPFGDHGI